MKKKNFCAKLRFAYAYFLRGTEMGRVKKKVKKALWIAAAVLLCAALALLGAVLFGA